jgi:hypothetical protein
MAAAAAIPAVLSLASVGLSAAGTMTKAQGVAAGDTYQSEVLQQQVEYGELKATQTNAQLTRNLTMTLGNIDAVRAAAHGDPSDPTNAAVRDYVEATGTEQKDIKVANITQQVAMDEGQAGYLQSAASNALMAGDLGAAGGVIGGLGGAVKAMGA